MSWKDPRGQMKNLGAEFLDLSAEGARLETNAPIQPRTAVTLHSARYGGLGAASVRYCTRRALKYVIGVEFNAALALASPGRKRCFQDAQPSAAG